MVSKVKVRSKKVETVDSTDMALLVSPIVRDEILPWDREKVTLSLTKGARISRKDAEDISASVEKKIITSEMTTISTGLIRELIDNELFDRGFSEKKIEAQSVYGIPRQDLENLIYSKSNENSNISSNNPEAINLAIAETTIKQYMLQQVFSKDVGEAHLKGAVHIHDLGYPRVYCSSHSLEYIKKYGLDLTNLDTHSAPAKHARTLTGHLNTFLASMQAYYAGALGIAYINIMYAPYLVGMTYKEMKQEAQYLIFSGSQNAFSRGGQTLFLDFNIHTGIPGYLKDVKAIGPNGEYTGKTYKEYEKEAQKFATAMLEVWEEGDMFGNVFAFPKCDFHISAETYTDKDQLKLLNRACEVASNNGSTYFVFDRDEVTLSACCRLRTQIDDDYMLKHPESMRFSFPDNEVVTVKYKDKVQSLSFSNLFSLVDDYITLEDGFEIKYPSDLYVYENDWVSVSRVVRHKKEDKKMVVLNTTSGKAIAMTEDHPVLTLNREDYIPASCPSCGEEYTLRPYGSTAYGKKVVKCNTCGKYKSLDSYKDVTTDVYRVNKPARDVQPYDVLLPAGRHIISKKELPMFSNSIYYIMGAYLGDGTISHNSIQICKPEDHPVIVNLKKLLDTEGINYAYSVDKLCFRYDLVLDYLKSAFCAGNARTKQLPSNIHSLGVLNTSNIIAGLLDTDGCVHKGTGNIVLTLASKAMLSQVQELLECEGIYSSIYTTKDRVKCEYTINNITGKCNPYFILEIPVTFKVKELLDGTHMTDTFKYKLVAKDWGKKESSIDFVKSIVTYDDPKADYVYDITTESTTFSCNGILTHNCGFQNVTINLPQAAYRAEGNTDEEVLKEVSSAMDIAMKAHIQKKAFISKLMQKPGDPMWEVGRMAKDGRPYVDLNDATYIIGLVGLNECVQHLTGKELHEDDAAYNLGLKIVAHMNIKTKEYAAKYNLKVTLEESPAESATRRLAEIDLRSYPEDSKEVVKGDIGLSEHYYTNSIHFRADADISLVDRIEKQARFHSLIESGAIIHAFVGEERPPANSIETLVTKTFENTQAAQLCISPEFTVCRACNKQTAGLQDKCGTCGSEDVYGITRIVGYYSQVHNWNKSKHGELKDRRAGNYKI